MDKSNVGLELRQVAKLFIKEERVRHVLFIEYKFCIWHETLSAEVLKYAQSPIWS
jgi:hypothetical protein